MEHGDFGGDGGTVEDWNKFSAVVVARIVTIQSILLVSVLPHLSRLSG